MRIGFVGCGAIGSCYASYLLSKHEVCVLDTYEPVIEAIKKNLGLEATPQNLNDLKLRKANDAKIAAEELAAAKQLAEELAGKKITLSIKAGEGGRAFGSVSTKEIVKAIKDQLGMDIDKKKLILPEPIRSFGVTEVPIRLHRDVTGKLDVHVVEA